MTARGMVAAAHPTAARAGRDVLRAGGNAVDAAIATNAVLAVTQPHMCGIGGDLLFLVYRPGEGAHVLNATGRSGRSASTARFPEATDRMPQVGPGAVTVPGCVDGWWRAWRRWGSLDWAALLSPAIRHAVQGFAVTEHLHGWLAPGSPAEEILSSNEALRRIFLVDDAPPPVGHALRQPDLGRTLERIAGEGPAAFYEGGTATAVAEAVAGAGGFVDEADLRDHESTWSAPLRSGYGQHEVVTTGDNTPGILLLLALRILERLDATTAQAAVATHLEIEAIKAGLPAIRDLADPEVHALDTDALLADGRVDHLAAAIDDRATPTTGLSTVGDTTAFCVADPDGTAVVGIQSLYGVFGAGVVAAGTGVVLQNRGAGFCLTPGHPNRLTGGKRPAHTLMATMVMTGDRPSLLFSTMGGAGQPQTTLQVLRKVLDTGMEPQEAVAAPRWLYGAMFDGEPAGRVQMEGRFPTSLMEELRARGHDVTPIEPLSPRVGYAQAIGIDRDAGLRGGADIRCDGDVASC